MNKNAITAVIMAVAVCIAVVVYSYVSRGSYRAQDSTAIGNGIQAFLCCPATKRNVSNRFSVLFLIVNATDKSLCIDNRMEFPGNIKIWVQLPNGRTISAHNFDIKLSRPTTSDMMILKPFTSYGHYFILDSHNQDLNENLRDLLPGKYVVWAEYFTPGQTSGPIKELSLSTDKVNYYVDSRAH